MHEYATVSVDLLTLVDDILQPKVALETHSCSDEELGLDDGNLMYPLSDDEKRVLTPFKHHFLCLNVDEVEIYGDYNSINS